jgi:hypothetical protein
MAQGSRREQLARLEDEIAGEQFAALLRKLQEDGDFPPRFRLWAEVVEAMHRRETRDEIKDEILRPIFRAHGRDRDPRWRTILLAVFWNGLEMLHSSLRRWDPDPDERWQTLIWNFLRVVCLVDVAKRPAGLFRKVINGTAHYAYVEYLRSWKRAKREPATDPAEIEALAPACNEYESPDAERARSPEAAVGRLRGFLAAGLIGEADFLLLVATRVYGKSIVEYARESGIGYETAMKRRQRAEAAIRRHYGRK